MTATATTAPEISSVRGFIPHGVVLVAIAVTVAAGFVFSAVLSSRAANEELAPSAFYISEADGDTFCHLCPGSGDGPAPEGVFVHLEPGAPAL